MDPISWIYSNFWKIYPYDRSPFWKKIIPKYMKHALGIISVTISTVTFKSSLKNKNLKAQNNKLLSLAGKHLFSKPAREEN